MSDSIDKALAGLSPETQALAREAMQRAQADHAAAQVRKAQAPPAKPPATGGPKSSLGAIVLFVLLVLFTISLGNWVLDGCHNTLTETCQQHHTSSCP